MKRTSGQLRHRSVARRLCPINTTRAHEIMAKARSELISEVQRIRITTNKTVDFRANMNINLEDTSVDVDSRRLTIIF